MHPKGVAFILPLAVFMASRPLRANPNEVCHVGAQLHLHKGPPDQTYMRHVRAFVEKGLADYAMLLSYGLNEEDHLRVSRYLRDKGVHFLIQEPLDPTLRRHVPQHIEAARQGAGGLFLGVHWGELDSSGLKPEAYLPEDILKRPTRRKVKEAFLYAGS